MMHDFVTTENYAIFFVCPSVFRIENASKGQSRHGLGAAAWNEDRRDASQVGRDQMVHTDAFYVFHFLNAYEENDSW